MGQNAKKHVYHPQNKPSTWTNKVVQTTRVVWFERLVAQWRQLQGSRQKGALTSIEKSQVVEGIERLSRGLTRDRALIEENYLNDFQLLGAYLLFYWPISYLQTRHVLKQTKLVSSYLDLGAGPGPNSAALLDAGVNQVHCVDYADEALSVAQTLLSSVHGKTAVRTQRVDLSGFSSPTLPNHKGLIASHLLNELIKTAGAIPEGATWLDTLAQSVQCEQLVLIEPALQETSRRLLMLRDDLITKDWHVVAPCLHQNKCPMLPRQSDWCHASVPVVLFPELEEIAQLARIHKSRLKMTYLILQRAPLANAPTSSDHRIVSDALHAKGRFHYKSCSLNGYQGLTLLARQDSEALGAFKDLGRYDKIRLEQVTQKGDGLRLGPDSKIVLLDD